MANDASDSSSVDLSKSNLKQSSALRKKLRCVSVTAESAGIIDFLESLITYIRRGPKDSHKLNQFICKYLFATKFLAREAVLVDQSYFTHLRKVLVLYCVLEIRRISLFDDESMLASDLLSKITLLMQGCISITILDVLVDIDEQIQIRGCSAMSIMKIIYRKYLTQTTLLGAPRVLDDISFVKHLILYRSWYNAEVTAEKLSVFKRFVSTISPSQELRTNESFALLQHDDSSETSNHRLLLQQPLQRNALFRALRDVENGNDYQDVPENELSLDFPIHDEPVIKMEIDSVPLLHLPNEIIIVDDDVDELEIGYLPTFFERFDIIDWTESRAHNMAVNETIDLVSSDASSGEDNETDRISTEMQDFSDNNCDSTDRTGDDIHRQRNTDSQWQLVKKHRRQSLHIECGDKMTEEIRPILRARSLTVSSSVKAKKVAFKEPLVAVRMFERFDDHADLLNNDGDNDVSIVSHSGELPFRSTTVSSIQTDEYSSAKPKVGRRHKRKRSLHFSAKTRKPRTSIDHWMKLHVVPEATSNVPGMRQVHCRIPLNRLDRQLIRNIHDHSHKVVTTSKEIGGQSIPHIPLTKSDSETESEDEVVSGSGNCSVLLRRLRDIPKTKNRIEIHQTDQSMEPTTNSTSAVVHSDIVQMRCTNQHLECNSDVENSRRTHLNPTNDLSNSCQSSCCPDTTSSPQRVPLSYINPETLAIIESDALNRVHWDEYPWDLDVPSPEYSPIKAKRLKQNFASYCRHLTNEAKNDEDSSIPVDVIMANNNGNEMVISSPQSTMCMTDNN